MTRDDVIAAQNHWANSIVDISRVFLQGGDYVGLAGERAGELYGYRHSNVLFKPTKASEHVFRPDATGAMSYFVGYDAVPGGFSEDHGFAINAKKGFQQGCVQQPPDRLPRRGGARDGNIRLHVRDHGSGFLRRIHVRLQAQRRREGPDLPAPRSIPYAPAASPTGPVTRDDVIAAQNHWANSIVDISRVFLQGGDYVGLAGERAGELYGDAQRAVQAHQGMPSTCSAPTLRAPCRTSSATTRFPVASRGPRLCHQRQEGFQQGCVQQPPDRPPRRGEGSVEEHTTSRARPRGAVSSVEFTFGYKRNDDGKVRICLHHSSIP